MILLEASDLSAGYDGHPVVSGLNLRVAAGEVVALLGPNGAGKTTTLLTLAGELAVLHGEVRLAGVAATSPLHRRARNGLAFVTEERSVLMALTVQQNLRLGRCDEAYAVDLFPELVPVMGRRCGLLSGGEQQIVTLARALARRPSVLLVDELSLGLAPLVVTRLLRAVREAADRDGVGVLLVEQHTSQVLAIADHAHVLRRGEVVLSGTASEIAGRMTDIENNYFSGPTENSPRFDNSISGEE